MRAGVRASLVALLVVLVPVLVGAQGLGDAAARERQKREAAVPREKARVLTNDDLPRSDSAGPATPAAAAATEAGPSRQDPDRRGDEDQAKTELEKAQARVEEARQAVVAAEEHLKALQDRLNPMSGSFIYGATGSNDVNEELRVRAEMRDAEAQLAAARDALVKATQAAEDVRLRRAPPPE
jgi:hypothetical protein